MSDHDPFAALKPYGLPAVVPRRMFGLETCFTHMVIRSEINVYRNKKNCSQMVQCTTAPSIVDLQTSRLQVASPCQSGTLEHEKLGKWLRGIEQYCSVAG